jgi:predicted nucleic-acid-binding protein
MIALDTNVVARFVLNDDPDQTAVAVQLLAEPSTLSHTVLLELAWLLSARFGMGRAILAETLADVVALPNVMVADLEMVSWAIERFAAGADFADMMHLIGARMAAGRFATFDRRLAAQAGPSAPLPVETLA